jgi:aldehyde dehydrogenase (NAD+)
VPPPRGQLIRLLGEELRSAKEDLGRLVTIETGKILSEGRGEVQELIDICEVCRRPLSPALRDDDRHRAP